jgi:hypothetical protein
VDRGRFPRSRNPERSRWPSEVHRASASSAHGQSQPYWTPLHTSGLYADAGSAENDGLQQWETLQKARFGGMTVNERLFDAGLMREWDEAVHVRDRDRMILILSAVELENQAAQIADAVLTK